jgi:hypothetical protein
MTGMTGMRGDKEVADKAPMEASCQVATGVSAAVAMREPGQWYSSVELEPNLGREAERSEIPDSSGHWCRSQSIECKHPPQGNALRCTKGATSGRRRRRDGCGSMGRGAQSGRSDKKSWIEGSRGRRCGRVATALRRSWSARQLSLLEVPDARCEWLVRMLYHVPTTRPLLPLVTLRPVVGRGGGQATAGGHLGQWPGDSRQWHVYF